MLIIGTTKASVVSQLITFVMYVSLLYIPTLT